MNNWNRIFKPIVVLGVICVIVTGALRSEEHTSELQSR